MKLLLGVGFEPTHPKIVELKSTALDQLGHPSLAYTWFMISSNIQK